MRVEHRWDFFEGEGTRVKASITLLGRYGWSRIRWRANLARINKLRRHRARPNGMGRGR